MAVFLVMGLTQSAMAQVQGVAFQGTNAASTNYFLGKTGIGTNNPAKQLHVVGDSKLQGGLTVDGAFQFPKQGDVGMGVYTNGVSDQGIVSSNLALRGTWISYDGSSQGIYVSTNGNVGVGTSTPGAALQVNGAAQVGSLTVDNGMTLGGETRTNWPNHITDTGFLNVSNTASWASQQVANVNGNTNSYAGTNDARVLSFTNPTNSFTAQTIILGGQTQTNWGTLQADTSYYVSSTMTAAQIQGVLDGIPRNLNGHSATVVFSNGTYNLTAGLIMLNYYGGNIYWQSVAADYTLHTNQPVKLDVGTNSFFNVTFANLPAAYVRVTDIWFKRTGTDYNGHVYVNSCSQVDLWGCRFSGPSTSYETGPTLYSANMYMYNDSFDNLYYAFYALSGARVTVQGCGSSATKPLFGCVSLGAIVQRMDTNSIGTTENTASYGGLVVTSAGKILP